MKLILAIVAKECCHDAEEALLKEGFYITRLAATGGFLKHKKTVLLCGCEKERVERLIEIMREYCGTHERLAPSAFMPEAARFSVQPIKVDVGGGVLFILKTEEEHEKIVNGEKNA